MNRRKFLSRAAGGAALLPIAGAHAAQNFGVPFQILGAVTSGAFGSRAATAAVQVATFNTSISSYVDANGNIKSTGSQLPFLGSNGPNSIFGSWLIWLKENFSGFTSKRVLFNAVDPISTNKHAEISLWPGSIPATTFDLFHNQGSHTGNPYLVVKVMSLFAGQQIIDSWVVNMDAWNPGTLMLLDIAINGIVQDPIGLTVNQYFKGILPGNGYSAAKYVQYGFSNAEPPTGSSLNMRGAKNAIPWGSTASLITGNNQLAYNVGGGIYDQNTGAAGITIGGLAFTDQASNQANTVARLYNSFTGNYMLPTLGQSAARFANTFAAGNFPAIALFGTFDDLATAGIDPAYFGSNYGTNFNTQVTGPNGIPEMIELDTSLQRVPRTDTLIMDNTDFFGAGP